jgi:methylmalonyl-CoA epimerase
MKITRVNHLGVIIADMDRALDGFSRILGLPLDHIEQYGEGELDIAFLPCGEVLVELIKPLTDSGWNADSLRQVGPSIQHVAFEVEDIDQALKELADKGVRPIGEAPRPGAQNSLIAFLDTEPFGGILVELVQPRG